MFGVNEVSKNHLNNQRIKLFICTMLKKTSAIFLVALLALLVLQLQAQRPGGNPGGGRPDMANMPPEGTIKGQIIDSNSGKPMEYANVVLFSLRDSSIVTGSVSDQAGKFEMTKVPFGRFYLVANFIGFNKKTLPEIKITPKEKTIDVGAITLEPSAASLQAVEITGQKEHIEYQIDKKIVNVDQDIMAQGGNAVNALENIPSVQVDIDGNVSLRGSSSFTVLIDGRPSILQGTDALQQIPASNIDHIEIITNPSAKYEPDGTAGIINVILKEKKESGFNGIVNASATNQESYTADFLLNYKFKNMNLFGGFDYNDNQHRGEHRSEQEVYNGDSTTFKIMEGDRSRNRSGYGARAGADFYLSKQTTLSVSGRYGYFEFGGGGSSRSHYFYDPAAGDSYLMSIDNDKRSGNYMNSTLSFQHKFDDIGHQLDFLADYQFRTGDDIEDRQESNTDADWNIIDEFPYLIRTNETSDDHNIRLKLDYVKPISEEGKIEAGFQSRLEKETEDYYFGEYSYPSSEWVENILFSNAMDFKQDIHSVYGTYSNKWKSLGYQLGLRSEYTYREIQNVKSPEPAVIDRWDFFPTLHFSKNFKNKDQILASYTRRIERPRGWDLDPFVSYMNKDNLRKGNPQLEAEYINSFELGYQKRFLESLVSLEGYYRETLNKITRIRTWEDTVFMNTVANMNSDYSIGVELMINTDPTKWLQLSLTGNLFNYRIEGQINDQDISTESTNWNSRINAVFKLPKEFRLQLNGMYNGPSVTAQGRVEGFFMTNLALKKDFFKKNFTVTLSARDLFKTGKHDFTSSGENFYSHDYFNREAPIFALNLSYKINNYKRQSQRPENGIEMQQDSDEGF